MSKQSLDGFKTLRKFREGSKTYAYHSLKAAEKNILAGVARLPVSLKILLENLLRHEDGHHVKREDIKALASWGKKRRSDREIAFHPARVLMQDFTGVPALADLAALR
ncbi:MAG: aconitate hydratase, partial [Hyphomicrobiales bacterium]|nr:aconitate hydratase [Hyphomicrobiales bacterium]